MARGNPKGEKMKISFPATFRMAINLMRKNPLFYLLYLFLHSAFLFTFCMIIYFYSIFRIQNLIGSRLTSILVILGLILFVFGYTRIHVWAMTELKNSLKDPSHQLSFTHWNRYPISWIGTSLHMSMYMLFSLFLAICLFIPYIVYSTFYFFQPVVIALYPNETPIAYQERVKETVVHSKDIRGYLAFFNIATLLIIAGLVLAVSYLNMNSFLSIGLITIILSLNPIFKYTVGTLYFYQNWERNG
jgi:hypothetical protein